MKVTDDLANASQRLDTIATIGTFDGVHRGHQALISSVVNRAQQTGCLAAVVTFHPHPLAVLAPERAPRLLTTPGERVVLLERLGVDLAVLVSFSTQLAAVPARQFMEDMTQGLRLRELWVGPDFRLGRNREGDAPCLRELGREMGYTVHIVDPVSVTGGSGETISSSSIRALLREGRVDEAARLLGRYPSLAGKVVSGAQRGRLLGFPTANLEVRPERAVPADGVYAVLAVLGTERFPAVANVGIRPSFDNGGRTVETHILDFDQDIYGCDLVVEFVARLRDERRFAGISELVAQIGQDRETALRILGGRQWDPGGESDMASTCRYRYHEVEHTADRALHVWGRELIDLFVGAAEGMFSLMADLDRAAATNWQTIRLERWDRESLLVGWLNELLFAAEMQGRLFVDFRIETFSDGLLEARVGSVAAPISKAKIKAATFHDLALVQDGAGWSAVITLDV